MFELIIGIAIGFGLVKLWDKAQKRKTKSSDYDNVSDEIRGIRKR